MKTSSLRHYRSPSDGSALVLLGDGSSSAEIAEGALRSADAETFPIMNGVPILLWPKRLHAVEENTKAEYDRVADDIYDRAVDWQFAAFLEDEHKVRESMADLLDVRSDMRVLEVGCGTGRDSFRLARRLGAAGELHMQDLSPRMVEVCRSRMDERRRERAFGCALEYSCSNAVALPYADDYFDAVFHFGGFNQFGDLRRGASELTRVCRTGGRVLIGDEAVAPWLKGSEFEGVVTANNALFKADAPLWAIPESAREVTVRWLIANCFYVFAFTKGEGPPPLDLDLPHAGSRGGSLRTRYFGVLEGVSPETKSLVARAAAQAGLSQHAWLDRTVKAAAKEGSK